MVVKTFNTRKQRQEDISGFEVSLIYIGHPGIPTLTLSQKQQSKPINTLRPKRGKNDQPGSLAGGYPLSTQCGYNLARRANGAQATGNMASWALLGSQLRQHVAREKSSPNVLCDTRQGT